VQMMSRTFAPYIHLYFLVLVDFHRLSLEQKLYHRNTHRCQNLPLSSGLKYPSKQHDVLSKLKDASKQHHQHVGVVVVGGGGGGGIVGGGGGGGVVVVVVGVYVGVGVVGIVVGGGGGVVCCVLTFVVAYPGQNLTFETLSPVKNLRMVSVGRLHSYCPTTLHLVGARAGRHYCSARHLKNHRIPRLLPRLVANRLNPKTGRSLAKSVASSLKQQHLA